MTLEEEIAVILRTRRNLIDYTELCGLITTDFLTANHPRLAEALARVSIEEEQAGRGLLGMLVVSTKTGRPGKGFYKAMAKAGRELDEDDGFFLDQIVVIRSAAR